MAKRRPKLTMRAEVLVPGDKPVMCYWLEADGRRICVVPEGATFCWADGRLVMAHPDRPASWVDLDTGTITPVPFADPPSKHAKAGA